MLVALVICLPVLTAFGIERMEEDHTVFNELNDTTPEPLQTILTREDLRRIGVTRLHEIFLLLDHWNGTSVNGQDWRISTSGSAGYEGNGWVILVDDHPVPVSLPGWNSFNHVPVTLGEIERITVIEAPGIYHGRFVDRGLIHIHTRTEEQGLRVYGRMMAGNEINDPGPYEFTERTSPNEERIGPDLELGTSYRAERWFIQGSGSETRHRYTDRTANQTDAFSG